MRVAGVDPERSFSGGEVQVIGLTRELLRAGHEAELLCDPDGELWQRAKQKSITCRPLKIRNSLDAPAGLRLRRLLTDHYYDVVHFHTARAHAMAPYARNRAGVLVATRRMDYVPNRVLAPWLYNRAVDGVAAISEGVAQALTRAGVLGDRVTIIPSGVDCRRFAPPSEAARQQARGALGLMPHEVALGTIGALVVRKGHHVLIDAMALLECDAATEAAVGRLRCYIAGDGSLRQELAQRVLQRNLSRSVVLLGHVQDPVTLLNALDIFVMPSLNEGLGVAALEATAVGLPVIASAVGGLPEVVADGHTGVLVKSGDAAALADAIRLLAADDAARSVMGGEARRSAVHNWSIESMAERTLSWYHACLDNAENANQDERQPGARNVLRHRMLKRNS
jgi:glycosyltransferase involved in cell wall biosynthesis